MIFQIITIGLAVFVVAVIFNMVRGARRNSGPGGSLRSKAGAVGLRTRAKRARRRPAIDRISERL